MEGYFDESNILNAFDVFDPSKIPDDTFAVQTYGMNSIRQLATFYDESVATCSNSGETHYPTL